MEEWNRVVAIVEAWFAAQGSEASAHLSEDDEFTDDEDALGWEFQQGSATIVLALLRLEDECRLQIFSPILKLPPLGQQRAFFEALLRLNATELSTCAFGVDDSDQVILAADRSTAGMDPSELDELIRQLALSADHYDDILSEKFGAEMLGEE